MTIRFTKLIALYSARIPGQQSMQSSTGNLNDAISFTNKHRAIGQEKGHNLLLSTGNPPPGSSDPKDLKAWQWPFYCSFEVKGVAIFCRQFTRRAANTTFCRCFLSCLNCLQPRCYVQPATCGTTIDQSDSDSLFAHLTVQNMRSAFDWSIAMPFGINLHTWYIALQYIL